MCATITSVLRLSNFSDVSGEVVAVDSNVTREDAPRCDPIVHHVRADRLPEYAGIIIRVW